MKKKIAIVGAGIGAIASALALLRRGRSEGLFDICDDIIDVYHDSSKPIERVGQGSTVSFTKLFHKEFSYDSNFYSNKIGMTMKTGINYEGWGNLDNMFHDFPLGFHAIHYQPNLLSEAILNSEFIKSHDTDVTSLDDIQADYIIDCRGRHYNDYENDYDMLVNPINSALLGRKEGRDPDLHYTRCVATPHGWTFVIPNIDSVSYGYLYNSSITEKEEATIMFKEMFDIDVNFDMQFKNYVAKNFMPSDNVFLNGNRYSFIEPLEATSVGMYIYVAYGILDTILGNPTGFDINKSLYDEVKRIESFILWHYQTGSKYDTEFWRYAKSLPFNPDDEFRRYLEADTYETWELDYSQWNTHSFKIWNDQIVKGVLT